MWFGYQADINMIKNVVKFMKTKLTCFANQIFAQAFYYLTIKLVLKLLRLYFYLWKENLRDFANQIYV